MSESQLYVFYTRALNQDQTWIYKYPKDWFMLGTDSIKTTSRTNINDPKIFIQSEIFVGPARSKEVMKKVINTKFKSLKKKGVILRYKIQSNNISKK